MGLSVKHRTLVKLGTRTYMKNNFVVNVSNYIDELFNFNQTTFDRCWEKNESN